MSINKSSILVILLGLFLLSGCSSPKDTEQTDIYGGEAFNKHIRPTPPRSPEEEQKEFKLPPGFQIELYASEPDIGKPMNLAFDARGRLWVTQSSEYPFPASPGEGSDRITILEDTDGDGQADRFTDFSDTLNIPIGILPVGDGAVAYSVPNVYKLSDADGDGKADRSKVLLGSFTYKDTHGMVNNLIRGYDGWIHACHGYNQSTIAGTEGDSVTLTYGSTFRFRPDGSRVELMTSGRINPFGMAYDELGYLYSVDCHSSPLYQLIRGGDYPQWGKVKDIGFAPAMKSQGEESTALAGLAYYGDTKFPEEYQKNFYVGDVVASRVYRYSSVFKGSTPVGNKEQDFVLSADPWFRPVDIKLGPDGALYIADFYNRIIGHYEVPLDHPKRDKFRGRIWRVTYQGKQNRKNDWTAASVDELLAALDRDNLSVRMTAADQLVDRIGSAAAAPVKKMLGTKKLSGRAYIHGLWVLQRLEALSEKRIRTSAVHPDPLVRLHTMRILAEREDQDRSLFPLIRQALRDTNPHVQRAAVALFEQYHTVESVEALLSIRGAIPEFDTHLLYTTRLALRNLLRNNRLFQQIASKEWTREEAGYLADIMVGVPTGESAMFLLEYIRRYPLPGKNLQTVFRHIARRVSSEHLEEAIAIAMQKKGPDIDAEFLIFKGLQQGIAQRGAREPSRLVQWGVALAQRLLEEYPAGNPLETSRAVLSRQKFAIELAGTYEVRSLEPALQAFVKESTNLNVEDPDWNTFLKIQDAQAVRTSALRSLFKIAPEHTAELAGALLQDETRTMGVRNRVATVLGEFPGPAVNRVLGNIDRVPADLQNTIVMALANSSEGTDTIFRMVREGAIYPRALIEPKVRERILLNISPEQKQTFEELTATLTPVSKEKQALIFTRLAAFNALEEPPSVEAGRKVFLQNCSACHSIGNQGGAIGPNLDGIGRRGAQSLATKILDPNRNISEAFRTYTIELTDGKVMTGLYRRDEGEVIVFAGITGEEFSVDKKDVVKRTASKYTLMPGNFGDILSQEEFNALLTYLLSLKN